MLKETCKEKPISSKLEFFIYTILCWSQIRHKGIKVDRRGWTQREALATQKGTT